MLLECGNVLMKELSKAMEIKIGHFKVILSEIKVGNTTTMPHIQGMFT